MEKQLQKTSGSVQNKGNSEDIRQDLTARAEEFSPTVVQPGAGTKERLDWRGAMRTSPFWVLGAATGLGFLATGMVRRRTTPRKRLLQLLNASIRSSLSGIAGPGLVKVTLLGIAARTATHWLKNAPLVAAANTEKEHRDGSGT
ncbi:MAG: hypothetical protein R6W66_07390 [Pelovirga sp.]